MIIIMAALGLTSSDLDGRSSSTGRSQTTRLSTMRFNSVRPAATLTTLPGLATDTDTSEMSYSDSVLDNQKRDDIKLPTSIALRR